MRLVAVFLSICLVLISLTAVLAEEENGFSSWMVAGELSEYPENNWGRVWPQDRFRLQIVHDDTGTYKDGSVFSITLNLRAGDEFKIAVIDENGNWIKDYGTSILLWSDRIYAEDGTDMSLEDPNIMIKQDGQYEIRFCPDLGEEGKERGQAALRIERLGDIPYSGQSESSQTPSVPKNSSTGSKGLEGRWKLGSTTSGTWAVNGLNLLGADIIYEFRYGCLMLYTESPYTDANTQAIGLGYRLDGNKIKFGLIEMATYEINGDTLIITDKDGGVQTFTRLPEKKLITSVVDGEWEMYDQYNDNGWASDNDLGGLLMSTGLLGVRLVFYDGMAYIIPSVASFSIAVAYAFRLDEEYGYLYRYDPETKIYELMMSFEISGDTLALHSDDFTITYFRRISR